MYSYQEVAYELSKQNRGYIFLLSAAKFILLSFTASFALNYIACTLYNITFVLLSSGPVLTGNSFANWGVYVGFIALVSMALFIIYHFLSTSKRYMAEVSLVWTTIAIFAAVLSLAAIFIIMLIGAFESISSGTLMAK